MIQGDSKRVPQYSACGKLFSPIPRELWNHHRSTLFDEYIISMSGIPSRMKDGMLVISGDVVLLFNPLQIDFHQEGAAAFTIKEDVETGKNHGAFLRNEHGNVKEFLHKMPVETLRNAGAVDEQNNVDIDTGAVIFSSTLVKSLFELITTNGEVDPIKFDRFVDEKVRLSFYGDFLYPLASDSTLEGYYKEKPEGTYSEELTACRTAVWNAIGNNGMKLLYLSPAAFIHFGTTKELLYLMTQEISNYSFLDWERKINTNQMNGDYTAINSFVSNQALVLPGCYIEDSILGDESFIGENCIISHVELTKTAVPPDTVLHGIELIDGRFVVRIYDSNSNPKGTYEDNVSFLKCSIQSYMEDYQLKINDLWESDDHSIWNAKLYPICHSMDEAVHASLDLYNGFPVKSERMSLCSSFNSANVTQILPWQTKLEDKVKAECFMNAIKERVFVEDLLSTSSPITDNQYRILIERAQQSGLSEKMRIYYYLSCALSQDKKQLENLCFTSIQEAIAHNVEECFSPSNHYRIVKDKVEVRLPLRVNWGGGWSDTPPYCIENGGMVLNAAIKVSGELPVEVVLKKLNERKVIFESTDSGVLCEFTELVDLQNCQDTFDPFALHKAALLACGVIPAMKTKSQPESELLHQSEGVTLKTILDQLGGGIYLSTCVKGVPRGSGLGTSSILAGACVKGIFEFFGEQISDNELYYRVLCLEQMMSTGGGWQDQVGGLAPGIKMVSTQSGVKQVVQCESLKISLQTMDELESRFCLIYTGQRRLARNLLREVVGRYIASNPVSIQVLHEIQRVAVLMRFELEKGNVDLFAQLLDKQWELSKQLDNGCTNTCIEQIFMTCEDLIDGKMICGAGGGGFLQVILKKQFTLSDLRERLKAVFGDTGVDVWECEFAM
ncbi:MAG: fucose pyrophosphorylase domain-containing protein [Saccharofermentanales bacterium]